jgi:hypothetical protein
MGLFSVFRTGIFAAKIAGHLIDLGVDVNKLDPACARVLYIIERDGPKQKMTSYEAAWKFFCVAFGNLPTACILVPMASPEFAVRGRLIALTWESKGKLRKAHLDAGMNQLAEQALR